jgi:hypothetical protein
MHNHVVKHIRNEQEKLKSSEEAGKDGWALLQADTQWCQNQRKTIPIIRKSHEFYICGSVHHRSILSNNQRDAALSSHIYYSLPRLLYMFRVLSAPIIRSTLKL